MFISNLWVVLMIRVVNLMIGLPSMVNLYRRRWISYEPDVPRPVYILEKKPKCKPDGGPSDSHLQMKMWIGWPLIRFTILFPKCKSDGVLSGLQFFSKCKSDEGHSVQYFFFLEKSRRSFWSFLEEKFWHF